MYDDDDLEGWGDEDEMGVASAFVMAFLIGAVSVTIIGAAIAWNAVSLTAATVQKMRSRR